MAKPGIRADQVSHPEKAGQRGRMEEREGEDGGVCGCGQRWEEVGTGGSQQWRASEVQFGDRPPGGAEGSHCRPAPPIVRAALRFLSFWRQ